MTFKYLINQRNQYNTQQLLSNHKQIKDRTESMLFQHTISSLPFKLWIWKDAENKKMLGLSLIIMLISFTWLKIAYPFPNFMPPDSYSYLETAYKNEFINIWPIGYSRFIRLISSLSSSHFVLITIQYLLLMSAILYFLLTIRFLLCPATWLFRILLVITISNPLLPHIANFISSDCLFTSLSLIWFTQLIWICYKPSNKTLLLHAIILVFAFTVRFMALYYPLVSITVIIIQKAPNKTKWLGIGSILLLLFSFIGRTQLEYQQKTNTVQYSAFGGWQLAANALYGYAYAKPDDPSILPGRFRPLHALVNRHMDSLRNLKYRPDHEVGIYYLWDFKSPLRTYMALRWKNDSTTSLFKKWANMAPLYQQYGRWLIMRHPHEFIRYYLWPNLIKYYSPPVKFMGSYNQNAKTVLPIAVTWFDWSNNELPTRTRDKEIHVTAIFPTLLSIINPLFLLASISFLLFGGLTKCNSICKRVLGLMWLIWLINTAFSVFSAPTELRYQIFPIIITIHFCGLIITWIIQALQTQPAAKQHQQAISAKKNTLSIDT